MLPQSAPSAYVLEGQGAWARAHAWNRPDATFKLSPEDFLVEECWSPRFSGKGEHLFWHVERQGLSTQELLTLIGKTYRLPLKALGVAGLKDRQALTRQWVSLHVGVHDSPDPERLGTRGIRVLASERHHRKLRRGAHEGNRFRIVLRGCGAHEQSLRASLLQLQAEGVPNYFGEQRFGRSGDNALRALAWFEGGPTPKGRFLQGMLLSAARAWLFNTVLSRRVADGSWQQILPGEAVSLEGSRSWFLAAQNDPELQARLDRFDIHPSGPLWGKGDLPSQDEARHYESDLPDAFPGLCQGLEARGLDQDRRALRLPLKEATLDAGPEDTLILSFRLGRGGYATTVLRELVNLI